MKQTTEMGLNRTGILTHRQMSEDMRAASENLPLSVESHDESLSAMKDIRRTYLESAEPIGSVPMPMTAKGAVKSGIQALTGTDPRILIDKLGERLAFERTGVRLYDALILKCQALVPDADLSKLRQIRNEEAQHVDLIRQCMEKLGADSSAQTPGADVAGVASMGILQVITDPRTTIEQSIQAIHAAELIDRDCWDLLIKIVQEAGLDDMVTAFQEAAESEQEHLEFVRQWHESVILKENASSVQPSVQ